MCDFLGAQKGQDHPGTPGRVGGSPRLQLPGLGSPVSCKGLKHQGTSGMLESKQQPLLLHCSWVTSG